MRVLPGTYIRHGHYRSLSDCMDWFQAYLSRTCPGFAPSPVSTLPFFVFLSIIIDVHRARRAIDRVQSQSCSDPYFVLVIDPLELRCQVRLLGGMSSLQSRLRAGGLHLEAAKAHVAREERFRTLLRGLSRTGILVTSNAPVL